jgi:ABC-type multidrug transport system fused ATPase/permease subunit
MFGKSYEESGIEMSGGESQKVAIARALYKEASLIIIDEPTSALDPLAEADIYENFNGLVGNKTAIYISHRMSSSVFCDKILIIDDGKVADYDSHSNLLDKKDSLYAKLFNSQALNYKIG